MKDSKKSGRRMMSRRNVLNALGVTGGGLFLSALATGIPAKVLLSPLSAQTADELVPGKKLILLASQFGDPINANVPGTYENAGIVHSADPRMAATTLALNGTTHTAAKPWADLPQTFLDQTCFFHHGTYTPVHGELPRVQRMMDKSLRKDMLVSLLAAELAPRLGTAQSIPVSLGANRGGELLNASGRAIANVLPLAVKNALGGANGPLRDLRALRDIQVDRLHSLYKQHGTPSQRGLLDRWARSRDEVRGIGIELISRFDEIIDNNQTSQLQTAALLLAMNIAPVITVHVGFGGDNHNDRDLQDESDQHVVAIDDLQKLRANLNSLTAEGHLRHDVVISSLNVFGRTLAKKGTKGRDHNPQHHVMLMSGPGIRGGVVGGVTARGNDFGAQAINSTTGAATQQGDITYAESLWAAGKTLGVALGVAEARMDELLPVGKVVRSVVG